MPHRLAWLDGLRGIAALLVVVCHAAVALSPAAQYVTDQVFNLGHVGVVAFLAASGYLIPTVAERSPSLGVFWRRRFFRLYPLYAVSCVAVLAVYAAGWMPRETANAFPDSPYGAPLPLAVVANLLLLQRLTGSPLLISVYWTLLVEIVCYALVALLVALGWQRRYLAAALLLTAGALWHPPAVPFPYLGLFWIGALVAAAEHGAIPVRRAQLAGAILLAAAVVSGPGDAHLLLARVVGVLLFLGAWRLRHAPTPSPLVWLGVVSYSLYVTHSLVIVLVPVWLWPPLWLIVAAGAYYGIERPGIAVGRRLADHAVLQVAPQVQVGRRPVLRREQVQEGRV